MLIKRHGCPFQGWRGSRGKPFEPFGKDSICSEGGSTDDGPTGPCHINIADKVKLLRPSVQLPAGSTDSAVYKDFDRDGKGKRSGSAAPPGGWEPAAA